MDEKEKVVEEKQEKFDISKISNLNAMSENNASVNYFVNKVDNDTTISKKEKKVNEVMKQGYKMEHFEKYPRKFEFVQPERVALPSKGICYKDCDDEDVKNGFIWIYPMTMKEEEILSTNKYIYDGTATIIVLNNCIKSNINAMDLVVTDFYYLLMYLRKLSISDKFSFDVTCPNCDHKFTRDINISEISFEQFDENTFKEPIEIKLDVTGYSIIMGIPRIRTIREMSWFINNSKTDIGIAEFLYTRTIAVISPVGQVVPKEDWIVFFNNLPHKDSEKLYDVAKFDTGMTHIIGNAVCPNCGKTIEGSEVDLNSDSLFRF